VSLPALGVFRSNGDPASVGLSAAIGQLALNIATGNHHVKTGTGDTAWQLASTLFGGLFTSVVTQKFDASGTYTPTSGMKFAYARVTAGGGGGGGADTDGASGNVAVGGGGGAGGTSHALLTAAQVGASQTVTIGAAGTGGSTSGGDGANGGDSSIGTLATATGGVGGAGSGLNHAATTCARDGGVGGSAAGSSSVLSVGGGGGGCSIAGSCDGTTDIVTGITGHGGGSYWGGGARNRTVGTASLAQALSAAGRAGIPSGAGGSGAIVFAGGAGAAGGDGAAGVAVIIEFVGPP
jgi:hypothetical protein